MNIYDFDGTICYKDSTFGFWRYCLVHRPWIAICLPLQLASLIANKLKITNNITLFYCFLPLLFNDQTLIKKYCDKQMENMCDWYMKQKEDTDVVVSASPEFLIKEMCDRLGVACVASQVDYRTGRASKPTCRCEEKVTQFREQYPDAIVHASYGNADTDRPIIAIGERGYMVKNHNTHSVTMWQLN